MPTYRMYIDAGLKQWIDFITAVDASEIPTVDLSGATMFQDGTYTDADLKALQMYQKIAVLPLGSRPLVTDYGLWSMIELPWAPTVDYSIAVAGGGTAVGSYTCQRTTTSLTNIATSLDLLGVMNGIDPNGQAVYYRSSTPAVTVADSQGTVTSKPAAWSGPSLFP